MHIQSNNCSSITVGNKWANDKCLNRFPADLAIWISNAYLHK